MQNGIVNAKITGTSLGVEDHGIFTASLQLNYGGSGQCFGGRAMDTYDEIHKRRKGTAWGMDHIIGILEAVGVESWEALKGQHLRVKIENGFAVAICHFLEEKWYDPRGPEDFR